MEPDQDGSTASRAPVAQPVSLPRPARRLGYHYPEDPPVLDAPGLREFVGGFKQKVIVLHLWASWSQQSMDEMAELAKLQEELVDSDFQVISCSLDAAAEWRSRALPALRHAGANFPCIVVPPEAKAQVKDWLDPKWSYDLPARFLFDRRGQNVAHAASSAPLAPILEQARRLTR